MEELLRSWDITEQTIQVFRDNQIDIHLIDIDENDLKILIPDNKIADRIKFKIGVKNYREETKTLHSNTDSLDTDSIGSLDRFFSEDEEGTEKPELNLLTILNDNTYGRQALTSIKAQKLDSSSRTNLVKGIIEYYMKRKAKLTKCNFEAIADEIVRLCPKECKETYYVPSRTLSSSASSTPRHSTSIPAKGKLVDRYYNQVRALRASGVIPNKKRKLEKEEAENISECELDNEEKYIWLKYNRDPWPDVEQKWEETYILRKKKFYETDKKLAEILNEWPCIKSVNGHRLIEIDFRCYYADKHLKLFERWEPFVEKFKNEKDLKYELAEYLDCDTNTRDFILMSSLPYKIKPTSKIVDPLTKKYHRVSLAESLEGFILRVNNYSDIEEALKNRRKFYDRRGLTCQPTVVCIGAVENLGSFYVVIDDIKYKFDSIIKALDICFKSFMVLNLAYPKESEQVWLFIQQYFYEIHLKMDKKFGNIANFIKELN